VAVQLVGDPPSELVSGQLGPAWLVGDGVELLVGDTQRSPEPCFVDGEEQLSTACHLMVPFESQSQRSVATPVERLGTGRSLDERDRVDAADVPRRPVNC
jgi:hypothetical protein